MSDGGMSIGGPGGLTPGKIEKGLSELGPAKEADVTKLQSGLKSNQPAQTHPVDTGGAAKPWDFQATRITDAHLASERHFANALIQYGQKLRAVNINQSKQMMEKLKDVHTKGLTQVDAIELQVMSSEMLIFADAISKGVGKIVTGIQTIIKQQ